MALHPFARFCTHTARKLTAEWCAELRFITCETGQPRPGVSANVRAGESLFGFSACPKSLQAFYRSEQLRETLPKVCVASHLRPKSQVSPRLEMAGNVRFCHGKKMFDLVGMGGGSVSSHDRLGIACSTNETVVLRWAGMLCSTTSKDLRLRQRI